MAKRPNEACSFDHVEPGTRTDFPGHACCVSVGYGAGSIEERVKRKPVLALTGAKIQQGWVYRQFKAISSAITLCAREQSAIACDRLHLRVAATTPDESVQDVVCELRDYQ